MPAELVVVHQRRPSRVRGGRWADWHASTPHKDSLRADRGAGRARGGDRRAPLVLYGDSAASRADGGRPAWNARWNRSIVGPARKVLRPCGDDQRQGDASLPRISVLGVHRSGHAMVCGTVGSPPAGLKAVASLLRAPFRARCPATSVYRLWAARSYRAVNQTQCAHRHLLSCHPSPAARARGVTACHAAGLRRWKRQ